MDAVSHDAGLGAGEGHGGNIEGMQRNGAECDRLLFPGGQEHVHLAFAGQRHDFLGQLDELVRDSAHGRNHHHHLVPLGTVFRHARRDVFNAIGVAHRGAAKLLDDESHF